jgi:hypothetical protein
MTKKPAKIKKVKKRERDLLKDILVTIPGLPGGVVVKENETDNRSADVGRKPMSTKSPSRAAVAGDASPLSWKDSPETAATISRRTVAVVEFTPDWEERLPNPFKEI